MSRGIESGDAVRVFNGRGEFPATARVTDEVRPGVAASYGVRWVRLSPDGRTVNDTTSQEEADLGGGARFYDNAVEVERVMVHDSRGAFLEAPAVLAGERMEQGAAD